MAALIAAELVRRMKGFPRRGFAAITVVVFRAGRHDGDDAGDGRSKNGSPALICCRTGDGVVRVMILIATTEAEAITPNSRRRDVALIRR